MTSKKSEDPAKIVEVIERSQLSTATWRNVVEAKQIAKKIRMKMLQEKESIGKNLVNTERVDSRIQNKSN